MPIPPLLVSSLPDSVKAKTGFAKPSLNLVYTKQIIQLQLNKRLLLPTYMKPVQSRLALLTIPKVPPKKPSKVLE